MLRLFYHPAKLWSPVATAVEMTDEFLPTVADGMSRLGHLLRRHPPHLPSRRQIGLLSGLLAVSILSFGAIGVTAELVRKPRYQHAVHDMIAGWGRDVVLGMAPAERAAWSRMVAEDPILVLSVSSIELPAAREIYD